VVLCLLSLPQHLDIDSCEILRGYILRNFVHAFPLFGEGINDWLVARLEDNPR